MLRLFLIAILFFLNLQACKNGYFTCVKKANDAKVFRDDALVIPIKNHRCLVYSKQVPNATIIKADPFLNLYIIKEKHHFKYPFDTNLRVQLGTAAIYKKKFVEGRVVGSQVGLNTLAKYSAKTPTPSLVTSSCCWLEGIVTDEGMIDKYYLHHFINSKESRYGDIGIRVKQEKNCIKITASNPYLKDNPLKRGDCVVAFDGKGVASAAVLMRKILFSKVGSKHTIKIKRGGKYYTFRVVAGERKGGGEISDTFLELKGIFLNKKLRIVRLNQFFKKYGLKLGDKLIGVNGVLVKNQDQLREYVQNNKDISVLLFERNDNFQFFVNIK